MLGTLPFFGVIPEVLDENGREIEGSGCGHLVYKNSWPGMLLNVEGCVDLCEFNYFKTFPGYYYTGDCVKRDKNGFYCIGGRVDDTIKVSGRLLSAIEIENCINEHEAIIETAATSFPHPLKGEVPIVFVVLHGDYKMISELELELKNCGGYLISQNMNLF